MSYSQDKNNISLNTCLHFNRKTYISPFDDSTCKKTIKRVLHFRSPRLLQHHHHRFYSNISKFVDISYYAYSMPRKRNPKLISVELPTPLSTETASLTSSNIHPLSHLSTLDHLLGQLILLLPFLR